MNIDSWKDIKLDFLRVRRDGGLEAGHWADHWYDFSVMEKGKQYAC